MPTALLPSDVRTACAARSSDQGRFRRLSVNLNRRRLSLKRHVNSNFSLNQKRTRFRKLPNVSPPFGVRPDRSGRSRIIPHSLTFRNENGWLRRFVSHGLKLVLLEGIELSTSPLPRECSTTELQQRLGAKVHRS